MEIEELVLIMGEREDYAKGFLKGYEEALNEVWSEVLSIGGRSYSPHELLILAKTRKNMIQQSVEMKRIELQRMLGVVLTQPDDRSRLNADLSEGDSIMVREERPDRAFAIFSRLTERGMRGLSVTRTDPFKAAARYGLKGGGGTEFIWLTRIEKEEIENGGMRALVRSNLAGLASDIRDFLSKPRAGAVLLEGLEYLVTQYDFRSVLRFIQMVKEQVSYTGGFFILSADPDAVEEKDYRLIEKEMTLTL